MASNLKTLDSVGGFSVGNTELINNNKDIKNANSLEVKNMTTIIKDSIPEGQTWTIEPFDTGSANRYSYSTVRAGTTTTIKWIVYVKVVSITWT